MKHVIHKKGGCVYMIFIMKCNATLVQIIQSWCHLDAIINSDS